MSYTAPDSNPCTIAVSENFPSFMPLVNDVNESLFTGSSLDTRDGNIVNGTSRIIVVGSRVTNLANDSNYYSRALR